MKRKLFICLFWAGCGMSLPAQDTNHAPGTNGPDSLNARRARIEQWREEFGGIKHSASTNKPLLFDTNEQNDTNPLTLEQRRARVQAQLKEWHDRQSLAVYTNTIDTDTNLPALKNPRTNGYSP